MGYGFGNMVVNALNTTGAPTASNGSGVNLLDLIKNNPVASSGVGLGLLGLPSVLGQLFGGSAASSVNLPSEQQINNSLAQIRKAGTSQIGAQTAQANQGLAMKLASQGMSGSGLSLEALNMNRANAMRALAQLESALGKEKMDALMRLAQMQLQEAALNQQSQMAKSKTGEGFLDTGLSLLSLAALA